MSITRETPPPPPTNTTSYLPVRTIPGSYGWPLVGSIMDRLDYFWFEGADKFFRKRMEKHKSSVFRTNIPPSFPLFLRVNPNVIAVLDVKSFSHLFDMELVEKKNVLAGEYMPSISFTGGQRVCIYLDTSEPKHSKVSAFDVGALELAMAVTKRAYCEFVTVPKSGGVGDFKDENGFLGGMVGAAIGASMKTKRKFLYRCMCCDSSFHVLPIEIARDLVPQK